MESGNVDVINIDIEEQMKEAYLDYAMSVIVSRALPDVRDGLKPVHRRIIYGMSRLGLTPDKAYRKSAALVGDVMGKYHPHGDTAIYDAVVRLAQPFNTRYMLADGQGNYGSIDGDAAAHMRYTEIKMTPLSLELLRDINKNTVDFQPNYDESQQEPTVLPARFPNLIVNGSTGIAVGMATNMAPHNLGEVTNGIIAYLDNPEISVKELMKHIPGPDFPTGAWIMGRSGIVDAYTTGRGRIINRAVTSIEKVRNRERIIVSELPYQVNKSNLIIKIAELVKDKKIEGITDLRDESDRSGIRIVIELRRDANPDIVLNNLYKYTQMQSTFGIINLALVDGEPVVLTLKELISHYVDHQVEVITRRTIFDLERAERRAHIIEGLRIAIDNIDEIIKIIRENYSDDEIKKIFFDKFDLSDEQSQAILDMQLKRLSGLEIEKLQEEYKGLLKDIARYKEILGNEPVLIEILKTELMEVSDKFSDDRRTRILGELEEVENIDLIEQEDVLITLTSQGYVKRQPTGNYRVQGRGGKGVIGLSTREDDFVESLFITNTHDQLLFFTDKGKVYSLKAYEIPEGGRQARGQAIVNLLDLDQGEGISAALYLSNKEFDEGKYLIFGTAQGLVKKTPIKDFENIRRSGIIAINLRDEDELIQVKSINTEEEVILVTAKGKSIRFNHEDIRASGRNSMGVIGINLDEGDQVVSMELIDEDDYLLVVTEYGYGKKTLLEHYSPQRRGGKGIWTYGSKNRGDLVGARTVNIDDELILVSMNSDIIRLTARDISTQGRQTGGVRLKSVDKESNKIAAVAKYEEKVGEDNED